MIVHVRYDQDSGFHWLTQFGQALEPASFVVPPDQRKSWRTVEIPDHVVVAYCNTMAQLYTIDDLLGAAPWGESDV